MEKRIISGLLLLIPFFINIGFALGFAMDRIETNGAYGDRQLFFLCVFITTSALALIGSICSLKGRFWALVIVGCLSAVIPGIFIPVTIFRLAAGFGLAGLVLTVYSKSEYPAHRKAQPQAPYDPSGGTRPGLLPP